MSDGIIDLSLDINAIKPSVTLNCNLLNKEINLEKHIASFYNSDETNCFIYKNEETLLHSLLNNLSDKYVTIYSPIDITCENIFLQHKYEIDKINISSNLDRAVQEKSLIFFTNPSFLYGKYYELEDYLKAWDDLDCKIIIDETFLEFTKSSSVSKYLDRYKNLYIIKNSSKLLGLEQFTFSTLMSSKENIELFSLKESTNIFSSLEKQYFIDALADKTFQATFRAINIKNSLLLQNILKSSHLFEEVFSSDIHRVLCKVKELYRDTLKQYLNENKLLVYDCSQLGYFNDGYLLFNVGDEKKLRVLENILSNFIKKK
jgi:histidinol-phosphate/aromatic aminotransferase/cobyric acid decarboxylase-like protein